MKQINIAVEPELYNQIKRKTSQDKLRISEVFRGLVALYLSGQAKIVKQQPKAVLQSKHNA